MHKNLFVQSKVNFTNSVTQWVVESGPLEVFKGKVNIFLQDRGIKGYGKLAQETNCNPRQIW